MAESQESIDYDDDLLAALEQGLSAPRLAPYIRAAGGDRKHAIRLYLWNSRLSKAFLFPLNIAEVLTRNAIHRVLSVEFGGANWVLNPPFALTAESEASRQRAMTRAQPTDQPDDLVAALTFDFWSNLFRRDYNALWSRPGVLQATFPHIPNGDDRSAVQTRVANINHFRNRIAHHEPIHTLNLRANYDALLDIIGIIDPTIRDWVRNCSTVMSVVRTPPTIDPHLPGLPLASTNLRKPLVLGATTTTLSALGQIGGARPAVGFVGSEGSYQAITSARLDRFIHAEAEKLGGMIDLAVHTLADVLAATPNIPIGEIDRGATTGDALAEFFQPGIPQGSRPQFLLVQHGGQSVGVIMHPQVRYR